VRRGLRPPPGGSPPPPPAHLCDLCEAPMYEHNCKIVCPNCGYRRDCTDP